VSQVTAFNATVGIAGAMVIGNMFGWFSVDYFGRRGTMLFGAVGLDILLLLIGVMSQVNVSGSVWAQIVFMALWAFGKISFQITLVNVNPLTRTSILVYQGTLGTVQWSIAADSPSSNVRAPTMALANMTNTLFAAVWALALPYAINPDQGNLGGKIAFIFFSDLTVSIIFILFCIPETNRRTFLEIDKL
jgi:hypothetical protein